jgi:hypothetical protein
MALALAISSRERRASIVLFSCIPRSLLPPPIILPVLTLICSRALKACLIHEYRLRTVHVSPSFTLKLHMREQEVQGGVESIEMCGARGAGSRASGCSGLPVARIWVLTCYRRERSG